MKLEIHLQKEKVMLQLKDGEKIVGSAMWQEENNLSQKLLPEISSLLKRNRAKTEEVENIEVISDVPARFTTNRIAKTVAKTFNFAVKK